MVAYIEVLKALVLVLCGQRIKEHQRRLCIRNFRGKTFWAKFYLLSPSPPATSPGQETIKQLPTLVIVMRHHHHRQQPTPPPPPSPTIFPLRLTKCSAVETPYPIVNPSQSKIPPDETTGCPKKRPQCMIVSSISFTQQMYNHTGCIRHYQHHKQH